MLASVRADALSYPERIIFMQDNCPVHTTRVVPDGLTKKEMLNYYIEQRHEPHRKHLGKYY